MTWLKAWKTMVQEALGHPLCFYIISCSHSTFAPLAASEPLWLRAAKCYLYLIMNIMKWISSTQGFICTVHCRWCLGSRTDIWYTQLELNMELVLPFTALLNQNDLALVNHLVLLIVHIHLTHIFAVYLFTWKAINVSNCYEVCSTLIFW